MIAINLERCDGCGECMAFCPDGAIYLVDGGAAVDHTLCRECKACVVACPTEAIAITAPVHGQTRVPAIVPVLRPVPEVIHVETGAALAPLRARLLPMVGAALFWTAREIVPRLAEYWLDSVDRRAAQQRVTDGSPNRHDIDPLNGRSGRGRRRRRRRRGM